MKRLISHLFWLILTIVTYPFRIIFAIWFFIVETRDVKRIFRDFR